MENAQKEMVQLSSNLTSLDQQVNLLKQQFQISITEATQIKVDLEQEEVIFKQIFCL